MTATISIVPVVALTYSNSLVLNAGPCSVYGLQANSGTVPGWVLLLDAENVPAIGPLTKAPIKAWQLAAGGTLTQQFTTPLAMENGAILVFSISGPYIFTPGTVVTFSGEIQ